MVMTSNERKVFEERLEALNNVVVPIVGRKLTVTDFEVVNDYGDTRFKDQGLAKKLRDELLDRPIAGTERAIMEEVAELLNTVAPTEEQQKAIDEQREDAEAAIERTLALRRGEEVKPDKREAAQAKAAKKANKPKAAKKAPTKAERERQESRERTLRAEGHVVIPGDEQRQDVLQHAPVFEQGVPPEVVADRHARGILTPHEYPAAMTLTPAKDDPGQVLTPRDPVVEDAQLEAARAVALAERAETVGADGLPASKEAAKEAAAESKKRRAEAKKLAKSLDAARAPITTMERTPEHDPRAPGEQPSLGELMEDETIADKPGKKNAPVKKAAKPKPTNRPTPVSPGATLERQRREAEAESAAVDAVTEGSRKAATAAAKAAPKKAAKKAPAKKAAPKKAAPKKAAAKK